MLILLHMREDRNIMILAVEESQFQIWGVAKACDNKFAHGQFVWGNEDDEDFCIYGDLMEAGLRIVLQSVVVLPLCSSTSCRWITLLHIHPKNIKKWACDIHLRCKDVYVWVVQHGSSKKAILCRHLAGLTDWEEWRSAWLQGLLLAFHVLWMANYQQHRTRWIATWDWLHAERNNNRNGRCWCCAKAPGTGGESRGFSNR